MLKSAGHREWTKYTENQSLPIHQDTTHNGSLRLKSRKPANITGHREWTKYTENQSLPIHQDTTHNGSLRLKSRKPANISMNLNLAD
ncbi:putative RNA-directed DNA polymerase [Aphis craccivora]|uniref:Putative RNA-directed DNA polymerase n=1 Tax=Aphis craccivora TaxID=307492 RepID=A0A6G0VY61_APHCR|nr:putative RNA-directed DNA polymerase [Aphis craccivora]